LFEAVSNLKAEQFTQSDVGSYGSIRNTLVHWKTVGVDPQRRPVGEGVSHVGLAARVRTPLYGSG
jgi:hypothetical protein